MTDKPPSNKDLVDRAAEPPLNVSKYDQASIIFKDAKLGDHVEAYSKFGFKIEHTIDDCNPNLVRRDIRELINRRIFPPNRREEVRKAIFGNEDPESMDGGPVLYPPIGSTSYSHHPDVLGVRTLHIYGLNDANSDRSSDEAANRKPDNEPKTGEKRAALDEANEAHSGSDHEDDTSYISLEGEIIDKNPDQVRRQIHRFLDNGGMKVGEFQNAIGVSSNAYSRFMGQHGPTKGTMSDVYQNAWAFFKKRELKGIPMPRKKAKKGAEGDGKDAKDGSKKGTKKSNTSADVDISDVHLPGEEDDAVEVYDTCDEIRKKINAHLRKPGVTQAQFCRDLTAQYHGPKKPSRIQSSQLGAFRGKKGPEAGNTSSVFYAAYCFFEKQRIKEKRPKSKHRQDMENIWGKRGGFDLETNHSRGYFVMGNEMPVMSKYGEVDFLKK